MGELQIREQLHREPLQLLRAERRERIVIELGQIMFAQLHVGLRRLGRGRLDLNDLLLPCRVSSVF